MDKRTINANEFVTKYLGKYPNEGDYLIRVSTAELLLKTYGKELILECAERAEYMSHLEEVDRASITCICDEL